MKSVIILCGGRSKRMGKDKGSMVLNGKPLILHVLDIVKEVADEIIIVLRDKNQFFEYSKILGNVNDVSVVCDKLIDQGPLIGILTGLNSLKSDKALILPCDSPYITKNFILNIFVIFESSNYDAVVPIWDNGHIEPLHSIYKKNILNSIDNLVDNGKRDVSSLINSLNVNFVDVEDLDPTLFSFQNMNTIKDLNR